MRAILPAGLALALTALPLHAQQAPRGCPDPAQRQFDFWVGEWEVTDSAGTRTMGTSEVTREENGCLVHEHWHGRGGGSGQSLNYYDPSGRWQQDWVGSGGGILHLAGGLDGTAMVLTGASKQPNGASQLQKVSWIPQPDGRVRQFWQVSNDGGATWTVSFDGWYRRRG